MNKWTSFIKFTGIVFYNITYIPFSQIQFIIFTEKLPVLTLYNFLHHFSVS